MASRGSTSPIWQVLPAMQAIAQPLLMRLETALGGADGSSVSAGEVANALEQLYVSHENLRATRRKIFFSRVLRPKTYAQCALKYFSTRSRSKICARRAK